MLSMMRKKNVRQKSRKVKPVAHRDHRLIYLILLVLGLPLAVLAATTQQNLVQEAAGPIIITTEPIDNLTVSISQKDGNAIEKNDNGQNNNGGDGSSISDPGHVCLGSCPDQPKDNADEGDNEDENTKDINCDNGNVNLGDIDRNEHITINCNGRNDYSDQSGKDGTGQIKNPKNGDNPTDSRRENRKNSRNKGGGGGLIQLIRDWIQRFFSR